MTDNEPATCEWCGGRLRGAIYFLSRVASPSGPMTTHAVCSIVCARHQMDAWEEEFHG